MGDFSTLDLAALERKVRELQDGLSRKADANPVSAATSQRLSQKPPEPTGLTVDTQVGTFTLSWTPSGIANLKRYEVQVANNAAMRGARTFITREAQFTYQEGDPDTPYFARVRVVNSNEGVSDWSKALDSTTGKAFYVDLESGAASDITIITQTSGFSPSKLSADGTVSGVYASETIDLLVQSKVLVFAFVKFDYNLVMDDTIYVRVRTDGVAAQTYENRMDSGGGTITQTGGRLTIPGLGFPSVLEGGEHTFDIEVEIDGDPTPGTSGELTPTFVEPVEFTLAIWQQRR